MEHLRASIRPSFLANPVGGGTRMESPTGTQTPAAGRTDNALDRLRIAQGSIRFSGGIPVEADRPAPRSERKWHKAPLGATDWKTLRGWVSTSNDRSNLSLWNAFSQFQKTQAQKQPVDVAIGLFCAKARRELGASSCLTYGRILSECARAEGLLAPNSAIMGRLLRGLALDACDGGVRHARDIKDTEAIELISSARRDDVRYGLFWLFTSGMRVADLQRFKECSFGIKEDGGTPSIWIDVRTAKNVRAPDERYSVSLPLRMNDPQCIAWVNQRRLPSLSCEQLNGALRAIATELKWDMTESKRSRDSVGAGKRPPTTYSFRRNFMHHTIEAFTRKSDAGTVVDWMAVIQITGHQRASTLKASYAT
jgi:hypothetical protein